MIINAFFINSFIRTNYKKIFIIASILIKGMSILVSIFAIFVVATSESKNPGTTIATSAVLLILLASFLLIYPDLYNNYKLKKISNRMSKKSTSDYHNQYVMISNRITLSAISMVATHIIIITYFIILFRNAHLNDIGVAYIYGDTLTFGLPFFTTISYMSIQFLNFHNFIGDRKITGIEKFETELAKFTSTFMKPMASYLCILITFFSLVMIHLIINSIQVPINQGELVTYPSISRFFILVVSWSLFIDFIDKSNKEIENINSLPKGK